MAFLSSLGIAESALKTQRLRADIIAQNIANQGTYNNAVGEDPYARQLLVIEEKRSFRQVLGEVSGNKSYHRRGTYYLSHGPSVTARGDGVQAVKVVKDETPFTPVYDPSNPAADEKGYIYQSNVDNTKEQIDLIAAQQAYEANNAALQAIRGMYTKAMSLTGK
ncbi:MAG: flagellar basal body rod protein FlgC [Ruminococcus sp.]|jgi:flagellar basal-body rod protein FlgC|nr:flagellar basal body rod protein FlgC [Ruminococcus sp.]